jgi:6-phosphogluconolactonase
VCSIRDCANTATLIAALTQHVARRLKEDLARQEQAVLVVSGGKSPVPLFQALSVQPLNWSRVAILLADERWVPPDHADSNEALVRDFLLKGRAALAQLVPFWTGDVSPEAAVTAVAAALSALPGPFSEVILGMGEDGHIASLFPGAAELAEGLRTTSLVLAVHPPVAPHPRLSLSLHALLQSRDIVLMISGAAKRSVLERALGEGPVEEMPIRAILRQTAVPVTVFWAP